MFIENNYIFNFSSSYSGGGYKRLVEYVKAFDAKGGATFIVNARCRALADHYKKNKYFVVDTSLYKRIVNDCAYLPSILQQHHKPDLYYSYGIPIYSKIAAVNWFHLSNVLPLAPSGVPISTFDNLKMRYLGWKIRRNFVNADVISAESMSSLALINAEEHGKSFISVNGSDDELELLEDNNKITKDDIAVVVGTYRYKAIDDSFRVFEMIRQCHASDLKLIIIGVKESMPNYIRYNCNVIVTGLLPRSDVMTWLRKAKYYISTTYIENSYNAASEGAFLADESYISDIGPHRELLVDMPYEVVSVPGVTRPVLHVKKIDITTNNLKSWHAVISEMVVKTQAMVSRNERYV